jgi:hypothetical protein
MGPLTQMPKCYDEGMAAGWLWAARKRFLVEVLHLDPRDVTDEAKRPVVVFYGPSQVGKTGLILRLLGLREEMHPEVERILRGGREKGNSATITALRYGRATGTHWDVPVFRNRSSGATQLSFESEQLDDENALKAFGTLRAVLTSSEHGGIIPENALWVGVPSRFFRDDIHQDNVPILVDLPGEGSAEVAEKYHVPALVRKWLLVASTVVVVENVAHVMRLKDLKFGSETRAGWLYWPGDLAIALTRVFEDHTVRKWVDYTTTLDELVNRIREPIQSKLFEDETAQARDVAQQRLAQSLILPFDFGETLSRLKENHPRDHAKVAPWLTDGMERLREHVTQRANAETALLSTNGLFLAARARFEQRVAELDTARDELATKHQEAERGLQDEEEHKTEIEASLHDERVKLETFCRQTRALPALVKEKLVNLHVASPALRAELEAKDNKAFVASTADRLQDRLLTRARAETRETAPGASANWENALRTVATVSHNESGFCCLNDWSTKYWSDGAFKEDWIRLYSAVQTIIGRIETALEAGAKSAEAAEQAMHAKRSKALADELGDLERNIAGLRLRISGLASQVGVCEQELAQVEADRADAEEGARKSDPFLTYAREAFRTEVLDAIHRQQELRRQGFESRDGSNLRRHAAIVARTCAVMKMHKLEHAKRGAQ